MSSASPIAKISTESVGVGGLVRSVPDRNKKYTFCYHQGVLLPDILNEFAKYGDAESVEILKKAATATDDDIKSICSSQKYKLCVTMQEYWARCCTIDNIRGIAKELLKKMKV